MGHGYISVVVVISDSLGVGKDPEMIDPADRRKKIHIFLNLFPMSFCVNDLYPV